MRPSLHFLLTLLCCSILLNAADVPRIVSLSPALTELVCHLGAESCLVGRSSACNYPASVKALPVAGDFAAPNLEKILSLKPDLVISNDLVDPLKTRPLNQAGIRTEIHQCDSFRDYRRWVFQLGNLLQKETAMQKELDRIDGLRAAKTRHDHPRKVLWVIWDKPLMVVGKESFLNTMIIYAGGRNSARTVPSSYFKCSYDWLLKHQPDFIVWSAAPGSWKEIPFWNNLTAVREKRLWEPENPDIMLRPGPRIFTGIRQLHEKLDSLP